MVPHQLLLSGSHLSQLTPPPLGTKPQEMRYSYHPRWGGGYEKGICFTAVGDKNSRVVGVGVGGAQKAGKV